MSKNSVTIHIVAGSAADAHVMAAAWPAFLQAIAQLFAAPAQPAAAPAAAAAAVAKLGQIDGCRLLARALPQRAISLIAARAGLRRRDLRALMRALVRAAHTDAHAATQQQGQKPHDAEAGGQQQHADNRDAHAEAQLACTSAGTDEGDDTQHVDPAAVVDETDLLPGEDVEADAAATSSATGTGGLVGGEFYPTFVLRSGGRDGEDTVDPLRAADVTWFAAMCLPSHFAVTQDIDVPASSPALVDLPAALQPAAAAASTTTTSPANADSPSPRQMRVARLARILKPVLFAPSPQAEVLLLKGGTTNQLYKVRHTQTGFTVVLRVFGEGSGAFIDRDSEFVWQSRFLHTYGRCWNGMVYEFLDRHAPLPAPNVRGVALEIADAVALFHAGSMRVEQASTNTAASAKVAAAAAAALSSPTNTVPPVTTPQAVGMATAAPAETPQPDGLPAALQARQQQQVAKPQTQDPLAERRDLLAVVMLTKWVDMAENVFSEVQQKWKDGKIASGAVGAEELGRCPATINEAKAVAESSTAGGASNEAAVAQLVNHLRKNLLVESRAVLSMISRMAPRSPIVAACHNDLNTINIMTALAQMAEKAEAEEAIAAGATSDTGLSSSCSSPILKDRAPTSALTTPVEEDDVAGSVTTVVRAASLPAATTATLAVPSNSATAATPSPAIVLFGASISPAPASAPAAISSPETFPTAPTTETNSSPTPNTVSNATPTPASSLGAFGVAAAKSTTHPPDPRSFVAALTAGDQPATPMVPQTTASITTLSPGSLPPSTTAAGAAEASARRLVASAVSETSMVRFIDFEYAGPNFALYDVANHWNEWGGLDCNWCFVPTPDEKRKWMARYLSTLCHVTAFTLEHLAIPESAGAHANGHDHGHHPHQQHRHRQHRHHARSYSRQSHEGDETVAAKLEAALDFNEQQRERSRSVGRGGSSVLSPAIVPPAVAAVPPAAVAAATSPASLEMMGDALTDTSESVDVAALCGKFYDASTPLFQFCSDVLLHLPPDVVAAGEGAGEIDDVTSAAVAASLALAAESRVPIEQPATATTPTAAAAASVGEIAEEPHVLVLLDARRVDEAVAFTDVYTLVSHVGWAAWAVIQAGQSVVDFDFIGYGVNRWRQYLATRDLYFAAVEKFLEPAAPAATH